MPSQQGRSEHDELADAPTIQAQSSLDEITHISSSPQTGRWPSGASTRLGHLCRLSEGSACLPGRLLTNIAVKAVRLARQPTSGLTFRIAAMISATSWLERLDEPVALLSAARAEYTDERRPLAGSSLLQTERRGSRHPLNLTF